MSNDPANNDTVLIRDLSVALAELLCVVEAHSQTRKGDYYHERRNAKKILNVVEKQIPDVLAGSDLLRGAE